MSFSRISNDASSNHSAPLPLEALTSVWSNDESSTSGKSSDLSDALFHQKNQERMALIRKKYDHGLSETESVALAGLQAYASEYMDQRYPLPFDLLEQAEKELLK